MHQRYKELLQILKRSTSDFVSGKELAAELNVTTRTLRNDIKDLNENYLKETSIQGDNHKGYTLLKGSLLLQQQSQVDIKERMFGIIKAMMSHQSFTTYDDMSKDLYFSSQTIRKDVQRIFQLIKTERKNIHIEAIVFQGVKLEGLEINKRLFLESLIPVDIFGEEEIEKQLLYYFEDWNEAVSIKEIIDSIKLQFSKHRITGNAREVFMVCSTIIISMKRLRMNQPLTNEDMTVEASSFEEDRLAEDILKQIASLNPGVLFSEYERQYLAYLLISLQLCQTSNAEYSSLNLPIEMKSRINTSFETIFKQYGFNLNENHQLFNELIGRISKTMGPLKYNFPVENPFIVHIKKEYMPAYDLAVALAKELQNLLKIYIPENEIGYLALHIVNYLEKYQESKQKVAIVYEKNKLIGNLVERKIAQYFPNISPEGAYAINEIETIPPDVQTIITTIQIHKTMANKKIIFISSEVNNEDIKIISSHLKRGLLENYLKEEDFFFMQEASQQGLLKALTKEAGLESLLASIIEREQMSSTNIGNNVAMPHPFEAGNNLDLRVVIAVNSQKIKWGEKMAQLIFLFIPPAVNKKQNNDFFIGIHDILNDSAITNRLVEAESFDQFLKIWNHN